MNAVEDRGLDVGSTSERLQVFLELFIGVPLVALPSADEDRRQRAVDIGRYVAAENDRAGDAVEARGGAVGHRRPLREAFDDDRLRRRQRRHNRADILDVVGEGELAVLPRHPARRRLRRTPEVEAIQRLYGDDRPVVDAGDRLEVRHVPLRRLCVAMEPEQQPLRRAVADEVAAVGLDGDSVDAHRTP